MSNNDVRVVGESGKLNTSLFLSNPASSQLSLQRQIYQMTGTMLLNSTTVNSLPNTTNHVSTNNPTGVATHRSRKEKLICRSIVTSEPPVPTNNLSQPEFELSSEPVLILSPSSHMSTISSPRVKAPRKSKLETNLHVDTNGGLYESQLSPALLHSPGAKLANGILKSPSPRVRNASSDAKEPKEKKIKKDPDRPKRKYTRRAKPLPVSVIKPPPKEAKWIEAKNGIVPPGFGKQFYTINPDNSLVSVPYMMRQGDKVSEVGGESELGSRHKRVANSNTHLLLSPHILKRLLRIALQANPVSSFATLSQSMAQDEEPDEELMRASNTLFKAMSLNRQANNPSPTGGSQCSSTSTNSPSRSRYTRRKFARLHPPFDTKKCSHAFCTEPLLPESVVCALHLQEPPLTISQTQIGAKRPNFADFRVQCMYIDPFTLKICPNSVTSDDFAELRMLHNEIEVVRVLSALKFRYPRLYRRINFAAAEQNLTTMRDDILKKRLERYFIIKQNPKAEKDYVLDHVSRFCDSHATLISENRLRIRQKGVPDETAHSCFSKLIKKATFPHRLRPKLAPIRSRFPLGSILETPDWMQGDLLDEDPIGDLYDSISLQECSKSQVEDDSDDDMFPGGDRDVLSNAGYYSTDEVVSIYRSKLELLSTAYSSFTSYLKSNFIEAKAEFLKEMKFDKSRKFRFNSDPTLLSVNNPQIPPGFKETEIEARDSSLALFKYQHHFGSRKVTEIKARRQYEKMKSGMRNSIRAGTSKPLSNPYEFLASTVLDSSQKSDPLPSGAKPKICTYSTPDKGPCTNAPLPRSSSCKHHILSDMNQFLFTSCKKQLSSDDHCRTPIIKGLEKTGCSLHRMSEVSEPRLGVNEKLKQKEDMSGLPMAGAEEELNILEKVVGRESYSVSQLEAGVRYLEQKGFDDLDTDESDYLEDESDEEESSSPLLPSPLPPPSSPLKLSSSSGGGGGSGKRVGRSPLLFSSHSIPLSSSSLPLSPPPLNAKTVMMSMRGRTVVVNGGSTGATTTTPPPLNNTSATTTTVPYPKRGR